MAPFNSKGVFTPSLPGKPLILPHRNYCGTHVVRASGELQTKIKQYSVKAFPLRGSTAVVPLA